jgi:hypothetical protein
VGVGWSRMSSAVCVHACGLCLDCAACRWFLGIIGSCNAYRGREYQPGVVKSTGV